MRGIYLSVEIRTVLTCADALQEKLADRHLLRCHSMTQQTRIFYTGSLQEPSTNCHLVRIMKERTRAFFFLRAFPKLIEEHAVLLAPVLILQNDVNAPVLSVGDRLPEERMCDF